MKAPSLSLGQCATLGCLWEATAAKPGNVHRGADFDDMTYADFATSATVIGPVFDSAARLRIGELVLATVSAMRAAVSCNTHLGTLLLLAPLAKAAAQDRRQVARKAGIVASLTTVQDCRETYQAIRLAAPGGLGDAPEADVRTEPNLTLYEAMRLAADRDLVARQYANGFAEVNAIAEEIDQHLRRGLPLGEAIVLEHVRQMARCPDSLIARKCGPSVARQSADRASSALDAGPPDSEDYYRALGDLDFWLRSDGRRRNPGTTADLVGAAMFVLLAENRLTWPINF